MILNVCKRFALVALLLYGGVVRPQGGLLLRETFTYPDGALANVSGGLWSHHSGGSNEVEVADGKLSLTQHESEDVNALLEGRPFSAKGADVLYARFTVSFSVLPSGPYGSYFAHFKDLGTGFRCRIFATTNGAAQGTYRLGVASASNTATNTCPIDLELNSSHTVVARLVVGSAVSTLWVDALSEDDASIEAADAGSAISISAFAFRQSLSGANGMGTLTVDDLVVASTFAEVIGKSTSTVVDGLRVAMGSNGSMVLQWKAEPGRSYSIWQTDDLAQAFQPRCSGLVFPDAEMGQFAEDQSSATGQRYYRVSSP